MGYAHYLIPGTRQVLHIDAEVEQTRVGLFAPLLRQHGQVFKHTPYRGEYKVATMKDRCFDMAMRTARKMGLAYVEGFMIFQHGGVSLPVGHGWCVNREGLVFDPTCFKLTGSPMLTYLGIPINLDYSEKWKARTGYYGCMDGYFDGQAVHTNVGIYADPPEQWLQQLQSIAK